MVTTVDYPFVFTSLFCISQAQKKMNTKVLGVSCLSQYLGPGQRPAGFPEGGRLSMLLTILNVLNYFFFRLKKKVLSGEMRQWLVLAVLTEALSLVLSTHMAHNPL